MRSARLRLSGFWSREARKHRPAKNAAAADETIRPAEPGLWAHGKSSHPSLKDHHMHDMMSGMMSGGMDGMMWGMGLFGLLVLALIVLGVAALVKYLFFDGD
jgi:predicted lipid-binding transport protein (Tim44 family)